MRSRINAEPVITTAKRSMVRPTPSTAEASSGPTPALLQMQQSHGNAYVRRYLAANASSLQRDPVDLAQRPTGILDNPASGNSASSDTGAPIGFYVKDTSKATTANVDEVVSSSQAQAAGVQVNDSVFQVNSTDTPNMTAVGNAMNAAQPGEAILVGLRHETAVEITKPGGDSAAATNDSDND